MSDEELLDQLPEEFYEKDFDPLLWLIQNLPAKADEHWLDQQKLYYEKTHSIVASKLSERVLGSYEAFGASGVVMLTNACC